LDDAAGKWRLLLEWGIQAFGLLFPRDHCILKIKCYLPLAQKSRPDQAIELG
jgi:hypothetical protein